MAVNESTIGPGRSVTDRLDDQTSIPYVAPRSISSRLGRFHLNTRSWSVNSSACAIWSQRSRRSRLRPRHPHPRPPPTRRPAGRSTATGLRSSLAHSGEEPARPRPGGGNSALLNRAPSEPSSRCMATSRAFSPTPPAAIVGSGNTLEWCQQPREPWRGIQEMLQHRNLPIWAACGGAQALAILQETGVDVTCIFWTACGLPSHSLPHRVSLFSGAMAATERQSAKLR